MIVHGLPNNGTIGLSVGRHSSSQLTRIDRPDPAHHRLRKKGMQAAHFGPGLTSAHEVEAVSRHFFLTASVFRLSTAAARATVALSSENFLRRAMSASVQLRLVTFGMEVSRYFGGCKPGEFAQRSASAWILFLRAILFSRRSRSGPGCIFAAASVSS